MNLNKCYLVFALSMNMIGSCLVQCGYSFKLENNGYSVYMNNAFNGHAPNEWFIKISILAIHMFITLVPKDTKLIMIVPHYCGTATNVILV
jgi:hypothetical protein